MKEAQSFGFHCLACNWVSKVGYDIDVSVNLDVNVVNSSVKK